MKYSTTREDAYKRKLRLLTLESFQRKQKRVSSEIKGTQKRYPLD